LGKHKKHPHKQSKQLRIENGIILKGVIIYENVKKIYRE
jgi:hypothetical protein